MIFRIEWSTGADYNGEYVPSLVTPASRKRA
jgi:hypothetical protein